MRSLRDTQSAFSAAIRSGDTGSLASWVVAHGIVPEQRIQVYRNNHQIVALATMQATYPVIERLGGSDWFCQSAAQYRAEYPSRSGDLQHLGDRYPEFLRATLDGTAYAYFADVAALEWAYQLVLTAEERAPVDLAVLRAIAPEHYERLVFVPRPALRIVESDYPIWAIWRANQPAVRSVPEIRLDANPSRVLLIRRKDHVELRELSLGSSLLLQQWQRGVPLGAAAAAAMAGTAAVAGTAAMPGSAVFDWQSCLSELLGLETIAEIVPMHTGL